MDDSEEIQILRVDLVTGDYKIDQREPLIPKEGHIVKKLTVLQTNEILIIVEKNNSSLLDSLQLRAQHSQGKDFGKAASQQVEGFESLIIRHSFTPKKQPKQGDRASQQEDSAVNGVLRLPLRVHQCVRPPQFDSSTCPFIFL